MFLKLYSLNENCHIWINTNHISVIRPHASGGTRIDVTDTGSFCIRVSEDVDYILELIVKIGCEKCV